MYHTLFSCFVLLYIVPNEELATSASGTLVTCLLIAGYCRVLWRCAGGKHEKSARVSGLSPAENFSSCSVEVCPVLSINLELVLIAEQVFLLFALHLLYFKASALVYFIMYARLGMYK